MSDFSDDAVVGLNCSWCGIYFVKEHGFPVVCKSCWKKATPKYHKDAGVQIATHKEL